MHYIEVPVGGPGLTRYFDALAPEVLADADFPYGEPPLLHEVASGALMLEGQLAGMLSRGGAHVSFTGTDAQAKRIAGDAARDLLEDRYEDFKVFFSDEPWTPWFFDIAWDDVATGG